MAEGEGSFIWYELMTTDATAAGAFYGKVVGWSVDAQASGDSDVDYRMIRRSDGRFNGGVLALTPDMSAGGARTGWLGYVQVPDVDVAVKAFTDAGGALMMDNSMDGVGRMALLTDPQGAPIYVMKPTPPTDHPDAVSDVFSYDEPQHIRWNELTTSDQDAAIGFYADLFGWRQDGAMPMGDMGEYKIIHHDGGMIGAVMKKPADMPQSTWLFYIGVDDIDRAVAAVGEGGGTVMQGPIEIPGGDYSAMCVDPQGAAFGVVGPRSKR
jgi:hypothetical protein